MNRATHSNRESKTPNSGQADEALTDLEETVACIKAQIKNAEAEREVTGSQIDQVWINKTKKQLSEKLAELALWQKRQDKTQQEQLVRQRGHKGRISLERAFMTVAKRLLEEDTYKRILEEARVIEKEGRS
jgi:hypothetical protein